jgi:glutamate synthase domain-containing protein 3
VAARLLADWPSAAASFVKVMPIDYKRALRAAADAVAAAARPAVAAELARAVNG